MNKKQIKKIIEEEREERNNKIGYKTALQLLLTFGGVILSVFPSMLYSFELFIESGIAIGIIGTGYLMITFKIWFFDEEKE